VVCRNLCEGLNPKITLGEKNYKDGKKYCRRCEIFLLHLGNFCPCCGMALRSSPTSRKQKEKLRMNQSNIYPQGSTNWNLAPVAFMVL